MNDPFLFEIELPHTNALLSLLGDESHLYSPEKIVAKIGDRYVGLTTGEKRAVAKLVSESAYIADPATDQRICRILNEALQSTYPHTKNHTPSLRLIIAASDAAEIRGGQISTHPEGVIIITTKLLEMLDDRELKAVMSHELGHIDRRAPGSFISRLIHPSVRAGLKSKAAKRREEIYADAFAIRSTGDPEALKSALQKIAIYERVLGLRQDDMSIKGSFYPSLYERLAHADKIAAEDDLKQR